MTYAARRPAEPADQPRDLRDSVIHCMTDVKPPAARPLADLPAEQAAALAAWAARTARAIAAARRQEAAQ
jgi:hypothetical protein